MIRTYAEGVVYLDNAAMTWPKPPSVCRAVNDCLRYRGGNPGRAGHSMSLAAAEAVYDCRLRLAKAFGAQPENVIFTLNTTYALNMAIKGLLPRGGHAICSDLEHNSVLRPLAALKKSGLASYSVFETGAGALPDELIIANLKKKLKPETKAVICTHSSNILPVDLPIAKIGQLCASNGLKFIVDAAQSAGRLPIDIKSMHIDALCLPGQKGLFGPAGVGVMILGEGTAPEPIIQGGSGVNSLEPDMPEDFPERFEAGTLPVAAISGLAQGVREVESLGINQIAEIENKLFASARNILDRKEITVYSNAERGNVLLFNINGKSPDLTASELNKAGICVRAGFHCSALAHKTLGTDKEGAVRISFSPMNSGNDLQKLAKEINEIIFV